MKGMKGESGFWEGLKIEKLGFWQNEVIEEDEEERQGFRSEEVNVDLSLREIMAAIGVRRKQNYETV